MSLTWDDAPLATRVPRRNPVLGPDGAELRPYHCRALEWVFGVAMEINRVFEADSLIALEADGVDLRLHDSPQNRSPGLMWHVPDFIKTQVIVLARHDIQVEVLELAETHLENLEMFHDFKVSRRNEEKWDPTMHELFPLSKECNMPLVVNVSASIVFNGVPCTESFHTVIGERTCEPQRLLIGQMHGAVINKRDMVVLLVRGVEGASCAPIAWAQLKNAWPTLCIKVVFTIRNHYLKRYDFSNSSSRNSLHSIEKLSLATEAGMYYTDLINIEELAVGYPWDAKCPTVKQILRWQREAYKAHDSDSYMIHADAEEVKKRGQGRNDFGNAYEA